MMKILVTGCGGFLGSEIACQLLARGDEVVGLGRREYPQLAKAGMVSVRGDVRSQCDVNDAARQVDAIIHTAAIAGVWGPRKNYYETNTVGTRHVIQACRSHRIKTLVFCSSPSVTFGGADQSGVDESEPYPNRYLCAYPETKALAEREVLSANDPGTLATCALRPHLIWAADDPHLFPRLIERARQGRLVRVGSGENMIDTIHVRNAAHAHLLALDKLAGGDPRAAGRAYFLSQGEPIGCWDWLSRILRAANVAVPTRSISYRGAYAIGAAMEAAYRLARRTNEPPMTRFLAAQLAKDHYFNISSAKEFLGYAPLIDTEGGMRELETAWSQLRI